MWYVLSAADGMPVGGDDPADALRYGVATKSCTILVQKTVRTLKKWKFNMKIAQKKFEKTLARGFAPDILSLLRR